MAVIRPQSSWIRCLVSVQVHDSVMQTRRLGSCNRTVGPSIGSRDRLLAAHDRHGEVQAMLPDHEITDDAHLGWCTTHRRKLLPGFQGTTQIRIYPALGPRRFFEVHGLTPSWLELPSIECRLRFSSAIVLPLVSPHTGGLPAVCVTTDHDAGRHRRSYLAVASEADSYSIN